MEKLGVGDERGFREWLVDKVVWKRGVGGID